MIQTNILFSVNAIIETMKKHIKLMYEAKMYAEAMQTECALGLFIEQVESCDLYMVSYGNAMKTIERWKIK